MRGRANPVRLHGSSDDVHSFSFMVFAHLSHLVQKFDVPDAVSAIMFSLH